MTFAPAAMLDLYATLTPVSAVSSQSYNKCLTAETTSNFQRTEEEYYIL
jgi:hypothetical protein